jgi:hypothetical protein
MAFLPTGLVKLLGQRFTLLPVEHPIGFFFEAMYRTGPYWHFVGGVQVVAALLLLVPATALLGALLFLPVAVSILLITAGVGFGNTVFVAVGMVLSVGWLLLWDSDRLLSAARSLLRRSGDEAPLLEGAHPVEIAGWTVGGLAGMALWLSTRGFVPSGWVAELLVAGAGCGVVVAGGWLLSLRRQGRGGDGEP